MPTTHYRPKPTEISCLGCGTAFLAKTTQAKFCPACRVRQPGRDRTQRPAGEEGMPAAETFAFLEWSASMEVRPHFARVSFEEWQGMTPKQRAEL